MVMKRRTTPLADAARIFGKHRKQLHRWKEVEGSPFDSDGSVDVEELRVWATKTGRLTREPGRPPEAERLADAIPATEAPRPAPRKSAPESAVLGELTESDKAALEALVAGDARTLVELAVKVDPALLKRLAAMGRTRRELAEAERRELDNRRSRGELLPADEVKKFWAGQVSIVKSYFQALPGKLAARLVGQDYDHVYQALEDELHALLETFAREVPI
jgi:hypothetical protein